MSASNSVVMQYIQQAPEARRQPLHDVIAAIAGSIDPAFELVTSYGMIGWVVPRSLYPNGYHCDPDLPVPFMNVANQKGHIGVYHMGIYADPDLLEWFTTEYANTGWKLNMGKSCIRFTSMARIPYALVGELAAAMTCATWIELYRNQDPREQSRTARG